MFKNIDKTLFFKNILTFAPGGPSSPELPLGPGLP